MTTRQQRRTSRENGWAGPIEHVVECGGMDCASGQQDAPKLPCGADRAGPNGGGGEARGEDGEKQASIIRHTRAK